MNAIQISGWIFMAFTIPLGILLNSQSDAMGALYLSQIFLLASIFSVPASIVIAIGKETA